MFHLRMLVVMIGLTLLAGGCLHWPGPTSSSRTLELFGGPEGYELIHVPALARFEVYRLADDPAKAPAGAGRIGGVAIAGGPAALEGDALRRVSEILRDDGSYDWSAAGDGSGQPAGPTLALRARGAKRTIDLVFGVRDRSVTVYQGEQRIGRARLGPRGGELFEVLGGGDR